MANLLKNRLFQILALAAFLRLFMLGSVPPSLNWDEVSQGYTAYSVLKTGKDEWGDKFPILFRSYGEWKSAAYIYLLVPFISVLGMTNVSVRLPAALASIISVYLIYAIGKKIYSEKVGHWAAFLMAVTPWSFMLGRPAFEANLALTFLLAGIHFFLHISDGTKNEDRNTILAALSFGLSPHAYNASKIVVPILVIYLVWSQKLYKNIKLSVVLFGILAIFAFPLIANLYSGRAQARFTQVGISLDQTDIARIASLRAQIPGPAIVKKLIINGPVFMMFQLSKNLGNYFTSDFLVWHGGDRTQHSLQYHGVLYVTQLIAVVVGLHALFNQEKKRRVLLPLIIIALGILPAAITREPNHVLRSILAAPGYILFASFGIDYLQSQKTKLLSLGYLVLGLEILLFMVMYFVWYPRTYARDWQYGYKEVSSYLEKHADKYDSIVVTKWYGEPQLFLAYYGKWDPTWYQQENQQNLRFESMGQIIWLDQLKEYAIGKYTFKYINWQEEARDKKTLYVGKADDFYPDSNIKETIKYPDGTVAFYIVEGER